ncbi:MAG: septal ring lytic transglycosylase RlpA family protein [Desulfobulbaceae bacterium]|nr:MAG: septal ring lytic transglycosylase RlpA family protein [Desulfobulbaceae bacterium]
MNRRVIFIIQNSHGTLRAPYQCAALCGSLLLTLSFLLLLSSCGPASSKTYSHPTQRPYVINNQVYYPIPSAYGFTQKGVASWYGRDFHGRSTSNGETYNMYEMTGAHKTLPMNTVLLVTNLENNREVVIRVNDRGPFVRGRIIDLSYTAAKKLGIVRAGTARVRITALGDARKDQAQIKKLAKSFYTGEFYVQIGSFTKPANATRLRNRFIEAGHQTIIRKYKINDVLYHRVHVYVGKTLSGAQQARNILEQRGYKNAFVIAK